MRFDVQDGPNELTPPEVESVVYKFLRTFARSFKSSQLVLGVWQVVCFCIDLTARL